MINIENKLEFEHIKKSREFFSNKTFSDEKIANVTVNQSIQDIKDGNIFTYNSSNPIEEMMKELKS